MEITGLQAMIVQVMADFHTMERELTDRLGVHYQLKILAYRTLDNEELRHQSHRLHSVFSSTERSAQMPP